MNGRIRRLSETILGRAGFRLVRRGSPEYGGLIEQARRDASLEIYERCGPMIRGGPFRGQVVAPDAEWGLGDLGAIVVGCYEQQLFPYIEAIVATEPDLIINIGCAEGLYSIGFARRVPRCRILAVDTAPSAQDAVSANARTNGVEHQIQFAQGLNCAQFEEALEPAQAPAVIVDCEGCEGELIDSVKVPTLRRTTLLVELHDFAISGLTDLILERLRDTHDTTIVRESGRNPHDVELLHDMRSTMKYLAMSEARPQTMSWLYATPRMN